VCQTSDGEVYWVSGTYRSCKEVEAWKRKEMGKKVWCHEDTEI
jgi:hypothetical protein